MKAFLKYHIKDKLALIQQTQHLAATSLDPVLVFTMAKVGSLSVYQSLKKQTTLPVFHIHSLDELEEQKHIDLCKANKLYPGSRTPVFLINREILFKKRTFKVISLFRNPIERNLSAFFEAFEIHMGVPAQLYKGSLEEIETAFHDKLNHNYCKNWFENQFMNGLGINVYQSPFDKQIGYDFISKENKEILLLKSDLEDSLKEKLVRNFCNLENLTLKNVNITSAKKEATLYIDFKKHIKFSKEYLENQLESRYMNHFFTEEEKIGLYKKWRKG